MKTETQEQTDMEVLAEKIDREANPEKYEPPVDAIKVEPLAVLPPEPAPAVVVIPPVAPPAAPAVDEYRHKYEVLQGKYNSEVPALHSQVSELRAEINELKTKPLVLVPAPVKNDGAIAKLRADYGDEFVDTIMSAATDIARAEIKPHVERMETVQTTLHATEEDRYREQLSASLPDWRDINSNPEFTAWLSGVEPLSGYSYRDLFANAYKSKDVKRTVGLFNSWPGKAVVAPPPVATGKEELISPDARSRPLTITEKSVQQFTPDNIAKFNSDVAKGLYRGREAEQKKIEAAIDAYTDSLTG